MGTCSHDSCKTHACFNFKGNNLGAYCKQHAKDGMLNVHHKTCLHDSCMTRPVFNFDGCTTGAYCKHHAKENMVDVTTKRCSHGSCMKSPSFNVESSTIPAYCKQHADTGMVDIYSMRCSHDGCNRRPSWGIPVDGGATVCSHHKGEALGGVVINFRSACKVEDCKKMARWGLRGKQPTHCPEHGRLEEGLVCAVYGSGRKRGRSNVCDSDDVDSSSRIKTEISF